MLRDTQRLAKSLPAFTAVATLEQTLPDSRTQSRRHHTIIVALSYDGARIFCYGCPSGRYFIQDGVAFSRHMSAYACAGEPERTLTIESTTFYKTVLTTTDAKSSGKLCPILTRLFTRQAGMDSRNSEARQVVKFPTWNHM